jgi:hypothetical protein
LSGALSELIFYSIDSFKVQLQAGEKIKVSHLFRGAIPIACCGSLPSFGVFFGVFYQCKQYFCVGSPTCFHDFMELTTENDCSRYHHTQKWMAQHFSGIFGLKD